MHDDVSDIAHYYNVNVEGEHRRLERHQLEYDLTWRYFERYLPAQAKILEIGAATGRYTLELARRGFSVTAVDMSTVELDECRTLLEQAGLDGKVHLVVADARDLSALTGRDFDVVLLMGPLYHLVEEEDRKQALQQAYDRPRSGGLIFSAFISRYGIMGDLMRNVPGWIEDQEEVRSILEHGRDPQHVPQEGFRGYFAQADEIASLHEAIGYKIVTLAGVEPGISADDESYNRLEGNQRRLWLDLLFEISAEPSILAASRHLLYIGKKLPLA